MITEGIINIYKPQNMTSHDVVAIMRRTLGIKKIGHTGTLDPMATGVLPVCIGKSTRIMEYLDMDMKRYSCTMALGMQTDTQDIWGTVLDRCPVNVTEEQVREAFAAFSGVISQKPPMYSALKVNGKKLYEYAREGKTVDVKTRKIYIGGLEIEDICLEPGNESVSFNVECSKGTYIRTICQDAGEALGCFGTLTRLERTASGIFTKENAVELEDVREMPREEIEDLLFASHEPMTAFGKVVTDKVNGIRFASGWHLSLGDCRVDRKPRYAEESSEEFPLPIREEYKKAYNVFAHLDGDNGEETFMGVAFYDEKYKKLVADKVFYVR